MGLDVIFINYDNFVNEESKKSITLHKAYTIQGHPVLSDTQLIGFIKDDDGEQFAFIHHRQEFKGTVIKSNGTDSKDRVLSEWGYHADILNDRNRTDFQGWLLHNIYYEVNSELNSLEIHNRLIILNPFHSELKKGNIAYTASRDKLEANKQTSAAPGRAIRFMFPELTDAQLEIVVDKFRANFCEQNYVVKSGTSEEDFTHAYSHDIADMQNPHTTSWRKSLANSCMRYPFEQFDHHPGAAYSSGDFTIVWAEDENGCIAARATVRTDDGSWSHGPVYGTTEQSMDMVEQFIKDKGGCSAGFGDWVGARLKRWPLDSSGEEFIGPYLDVVPSASRDDGEYLIIDRSGEVDHSEHQGTVSSVNSSCYECGDRVHEDHAYRSPDGDTYCECCFDEQYFFCEYEGEYTHREDAVDVFRAYRWGHDYELVSQRGVDYSDDIVWVECREEYWFEDDLFYSEFSEEYFTQRELDTGEFVEVDGEYYREEDKPEEELEEAA